MQKELEKYGINMPSFGKIGGILANEVTLNASQYTYHCRMTSTKKYP